MNEKTNLIYIYNELDEAIHGSIWTIESERNFPNNKVSRDYLNRIVTVNTEFEYKHDALKFNQKIVDIGFNINQWAEIDDIIKDNYDKTSNQLQTLIIQYVVPNILKDWLRWISYLIEFQDDLSTMTLSIILQNLHLISFENINDEFFSMSIENQIYNIESIIGKQIPQISKINSYNIISNGTVFDAIQRSNGSIIFWSKRTKLSGLRHSWDHYSYPHVHENLSYQQHKNYLISAVKRTWLAYSKYYNSSLSYGKRVNYGFQSINRQYFATQSELDELGRLNYGTVIIPPYEYEEIEKMSPREVYLLVMRATKCLEFTPSINTIYFTKNLYEAEKELGNEVKLTRITVVEELVNDTFLPKHNSIIAESYPTKQDALKIADLNQISIETQEDILINKPLIRNSNFLAFLLSHYHSTAGNQMDEIEIAFDYITSRMSGSMNRLINLKNIKEEYLYEETTIGTYGLFTNALLYNVLSADSPIVDLYKRIPTVVGQFSDNIQNSSSLQYELKIAGILDSYTKLGAANDEIFSEKQKILRQLSLGFINCEVEPNRIIKILSRNDISCEFVNSLEDDSNEKYYTTTLANARILFLAIDGNMLNSDNQSSIKYLISKRLELDTRVTIFELSNFTDDQCNWFNEINDLLVNDRCKITSVGYPQIKARSISLIYELDGRVHVPTGSISNILQRMISNNVTNDTILEIYNIMKSTLVKEISVGTSIISKCGVGLLDKALGFMSSFCPHVKVTKHQTNDESSEVVVCTGIASFPRLSLTERREGLMLSNEVDVKNLRSSRLLGNKAQHSSMSVFELNTQADRLIIHANRLRDGSINNGLQDFGSGQYLNVALTKTTYKAYDANPYNAVDIPNVEYIPGLLPNDTPLPLDRNFDTYIYNSLFFDETLKSSKELIQKVNVTLLTALQKGDIPMNLYFNIPAITAMDDNILEGVDQFITVDENNNHFIKLGSYNAVPMVNREYITILIDSLSQYYNSIEIIIPTMCDYYLTMMFNKRYCLPDDIITATLLHTFIPTFICTDRKG